MGPVEDYEKLGAFYLGRPYNLSTGETQAEPLLYDAKDLTTHAVIVGMTGSGKTGLAITLLEEAAIDGIPVIAIDPKGDLGNLLLTFPQLRAQDFRPWIDESEAARAGLSPDAHALATAELWRNGLAKWGQNPSRIARFADAADRAIYTPGSRAGRPLSVLRSFAAPPPALAEDEEALRERVQGAVSGLLGLLGIEADPIRSREHILLATLVERAWREGRDLDLGALIRGIQKPPFERVGVLDLESFYPEKARFDLALAVNNLLASPGFATWLEGEPLEAGSLLYTSEGRPRISILSIAHLSEAQRMFVVTMLLHQIIAWMRAQPGSRTLRALLYMDEIFGYFPPTANPPAKLPMLTLLKQARAYGLGIVLATQNPVDLDYKGLSNTGTWFLGRLQTERDKARVLEGLEGAAASTGARFDRNRMEETLAGLGSRIFLMNNVHEDAPVVFHSRWALSYLSGPLTREQIRTLTTRQAANVPTATEATPEPAIAPAPLPAEGTEAQTKRPVVPAGVIERFFPIERAAGPGERLLYRPALLGIANLHFVSAPLKVDEWERCGVLAALRDESLGAPWRDAQVQEPFDLCEEPDRSARFAPLPAAASNAKSYARWEKQLKTYLYQERTLSFLRCNALNAISRPGESEGEFRGRLSVLSREQRDAQIETLRCRYAPKLRRLQERIASAEQSVATESEQYRDSKTQSAISIGATLVGAMFGRKIQSVGNVGRATTAMRGVSRAARQRGDIERAKQRVEALREQLAELERQFEKDVATLDVPSAVESFELIELKASVRKSDLDVEALILAWIPWRIDREGIAQRA
ncbi:MAG: DUF87 domain-containing protein [Myxococcales bacterium]|nr:DUF87 domain-containing protein [Myxococcales bacterium]